MSWLPVFVLAASSRPTDVHPTRSQIISPPYQRREAGESQLVRGEYLTRSPGSAGAILYGCGTPFTIGALRRSLDAVVRVLDFQLGGDLFSPLQVHVGDGDQLRFRNQAANVVGMLL